MRNMGLIIVFVTSNALAAPGDLPLPAAEHNDSPTKITLPAVPAFEVPVAPAGTHGVRELFALGKPLRGSELQVSGYVTWIYDCVTALQKPKQTRAKTQKMIDDDPTLCERAKFYVGDARDTPPERSLWVVDVPRPFNKLEVTRIKKADRTTAAFPDRCEPDPKLKGPFCVPLAVGDYVTLTGTFSQASPHSERNSDGLIVFRSVAVSKPPATVTMKAVTAAPAKTLPALAPKPVASPPVTDAARQSAIQHANAGTTAYGQKDIAKAASEYGQAVAAWPGHHVAWYGLGGTQLGTGDWLGASTSMGKAFELAPTSPMYAMVYGYTQYELLIADARAATAKRDGIPVAAATPDLTGLDFSRAEQMLRYAIKLDDKLWRAHYYLGRIARDGGRRKEAADELTKALASAPPAPGPWVALCELYRTWQLPELALAVAEQGTTVVSGLPALDVWYELGMSNDDLRRDDKAIAAFSKALEIDPTHAKSLFQRGQARFRAGKLADAKRDLEAYFATPQADSFAMQQANKMLMDIAAKKRP
jgi:tetratricopeptide (TPR) repeat protein